MRVINIKMASDKKKKSNLEKEKEKRQQVNITTKHRQVIKGED